LSWRTVRFDEALVQFTAGRTTAYRGGPAFLDSFRGRDKWKPAVVKLPPRRATV
jgi:hypothetical protein